ncbi:PTS system maltose and glucose-specific IIC / IIB component [Vibrio variabilis]|uniref:PTS system maltose and glucose-specific IIC / IIB component n=1 Tax=Vibrio variabilis TaxID=990271 RepID=A0ABQ0JEM0_9VIBR|nr:PTS system maltose and glucose-specific IIC / IIB component [Vibrio variabilis]
MSKLLSFDFWQRFGKSLIVVIAVMPAAGIMISLGKVVAMYAGGVGAIETLGAIMENIGWGVIVNLHLLFAVAIGGSWAKNEQEAHCCSDCLHLNQPYHWRYIGRG